MRATKKTTTEREEISMAKDHFEFARLASAEEVAEYLTSLAVGLKRGEISLESDERALRLTPAPTVKLELAVRDKERKGRLTLEIGWKRQVASKATDLRVEVPSRPRSS
jgi:amphi-Trp domain-containing protein